MSRDFAVALIDRTLIPNRGYRDLYTMGEVRELTGVQALVQFVILTLLVRPGSHVYDQGWGVGIADVLRRPVGSLDDVRATMTIAVAQAREQIFARQTGESMSDDERLSDLVLRSVEQDEAGISIVLDVSTAAGQSVAINSRDYFA